MVICRSCVYYKASTSEQNKGTCHRYPPQVAFYSRVINRFPEVGATEWCGEHKRKDAEAV